VQVNNDAGTIQPRCPAELKHHPDYSGDFIKDGIMSGYQRIIDALDGRKVSPVPRMLHSFMTAVAEKGYTQNEYRWSAEKIARAHIDFVRKYNLDGILLDVDTCLEAGAVGVPVDFPEDEPARIITGLSGGLDACIDAMEKEVLLKDERIQIYLESINLMRKEVGGDLLIRGNADQGPFSLAMLSVGIMEFMMMLMDESVEEKVKLLIDRALDVHLEFHRLVKEAGADITSFGDSSCGPDLISPELYREFSLPYHKKLAEKLKAQDIITICHICGNLDLILEDVVSAGFPAIEADYKTDIPRAAKIMKDRAVLFGPIDPSGIFYYGTPADVARETDAVLKLFPDGGLVIGAGCALPAEVSEENIRAFCKAAETPAGE